MNENRELKPVGSYLGVDEEGYLIGEVSKEKIQPELWPVINESIECAREVFGDNIHSIYVRGSTAKGTFVPGISDLDTEFVLHTQPDDETKQNFKDKMIEIEDRHPEVTKIERVIWTVDGFTTEPDTIRKYQTVCVFGEDLTQAMPKMKPGAESASKLGLILEQIDKSISLLESGQDTITIKARSVWLGKRLIRRAHELIEGKLQRFTRDIYPCYEGASQVWPEHEPLFRKVAEVAVFGTEDQEYLIDLARQMHNFLEEEIGKLGLK